MIHGRSYIFLLITILIIMTSHALAQEEPCNQPKQRAKLLFDKGTHIWSKDNNKAKALIFKSIKHSPQWVVPYYYLAKKYYNKAQIIQYDNRKVSNLSRLLNRASDNFEEVAKICPQYEKYKAYYYLGKINYEGGNLSGAHTWLKKYTSNVSLKNYMPETSKMLESCEAFQKLVDNPVNFDPVAVPGVCTSNDEFMPLIAPDGSYMMFTRKLWKQERGAYSPSMTEEFSISKFIRWDSVGEPVFDESKPMPYPFNEGPNQGAASITIDNKKLFLTVCKQIEMPDGRPYKNCDIYQTQKKYGKWGPLQKLNRKINGLTTWEGHPSVSPDGKILYFASYRPKGKGGIDIYYSELDSSGYWGPPINLGDPINTKLNERAPFIHPDNKTLYFASDGHPGVGGYDIFISRRKDSIWSAPENIGYPINSEQDESGFIVSTGGHYAFFSSNAYKGYGGYDIFGFELHEEAQPDKVMFVRGKLVDGKRSILKSASIELKNMSSNEIKKGVVDNYTGKYAIAIPAQIEDSYMLTIKKPDYSFTSKIIEPAADSISENLQIKLNFIVKKTKVGANTRLNDVLFPFNSTELTKQSKATLDNFASYLKNNPDIKIRIDGHTDNIADAGYNMRLSKKRARKVYRYLIDRNISRSRLSYEGFGETKPIADNSSEAGKKKNRRTEFVILEK
ncbi:Root adhesin [Salinivirga cyanobacteriivorans]|uniref:Root adhesin n=1 Tax=Salinivirga cyanobacteriivorans TaxID=1307839 RepID=A0A0S2HVR4_9BACT|nr:OmpA family protein [Salinivirga cyanobacteriivorans]ALO14155.1 Root adhesin [Salinivirga cyanobacteriivorans]